MEDIERAKKGQEDKIKRIQAEATADLERGEFEHKETMEG
jgi:hypothetical protein